MRIRIKIILLGLCIGSAWIASAQSLMPFDNGFGKHGYKDGSGNIIIQPKYGEANRFINGLAKVKKFNGKWIFIDTTGTEVISAGQYLEIRDFKEGLAAVQIQKSGLRLWGYIDKTGKEVIPPQYSQAEDFSGGKAKVTLDNKDGYINTSGKETTGPKQKLELNEGLAPVKNFDKYGYADASGNFVIEPKYDFAGKFNNGVAAVNIGRQQTWEGKIITNGKFGYINKKGEYIIPLKYERGDPFQNGIAIVGLPDPNKTDTTATNKKLLFGAIDITDKEILPIKYDLAYEYKGYIKLELNNKRGLADSTGKQIIPTTYDSIGVSFENGFIIVKQDDKYDFINTSGKLLTGLKYDDVKSFFNGMAPVKTESKWGFIDATGAEVIPAKYDFVGTFSDKGTAYAKIGDDRFDLDKKGNATLRKNTVAAVGSGNSSSHCVCLLLEKSESSFGSVRVKNYYYFVTISDKSGTASNSQLINAARSSLWGKNLSGYSESDVSLDRNKDCVSMKNGIRGITDFSVNYATVD